MHPCQNLFHLLETFFTFHGKQNVPQSQVLQGRCIQSELVAKSLIDLENRPR